MKCDKPDKTLASSTNDVCTTATRASNENLMVYDSVTGERWFEYRSTVRLKIVHVRL